MNTGLTAALISAFLFASVGIGRWIRRRLPEHHLDSETRDTVKLAMGLIATMSALLLGLLVSSAKGSYDATHGQVVQIAAKVAFLYRVLDAYGPEATEVRRDFSVAAREMIKHIWPDGAGDPARSGTSPHSADAAYAAIHKLSPRDDIQRALKTQASSLALELAQLRALVVAQSASTILKPLLFVLVAWLVAIFLSFSLLAPPNATATLALLVAALAVGGAIFLILELNRPFGGVFRVSSEAVLNALPPTTP